MLAQKSRPVTDPGSLRGLVADMAETMYANKGAGLAAVQVGELLRVFIVEPTAAGRKETDPPLVFINPQILEMSKEIEVADEGCLSFPGIYVPVARSLWAKTRATDLDGRVFEIEGEGLFARAMQHESDHLDGRVLSDHVGRIKRQLIARKLARAEAAEAEAEE